MKYKTHVLNPKDLYVKVSMIDVDGVHVKAGYDTTGRITRGPDRETDGFFKKMLSYNSKKENVPVILTSGRSLAQIIGIAKRSGNGNLIIAEHGMVFYDQSTDTKTRIFDVVPELGVYNDALDVLRQIRGHLSESTGNILKKLEEYDPRSISIPDGKEVSATVDIPYKNGRVGSVSDRVDRMEFFRAVWDEVSSYKKFMFTKQKDLMGRVPASKNLIEVTLDQSAVNFKPPVTKPDSLRYIIDEHGPLYRKYVATSPDKVGLADDRDIGSMVEMARLGGKVFTVANASEEVLECAQRVYRIGHNGYVSPYNDIRGLEDILARINRHNPWAAA